MSYEFKGTPGPWEIDDETRPVEVCTIHHTSFDNGFVYVRGEIGRWDVDEDENTANAQLIAAAPELFDSAKEMRDTIVELCQTFDVPLPEATLNRNDAAFAKATGGEV